MEAGLVCLGRHTCLLSLLSSIMAASVNLAEQFRAMAAEMGTDWLTLAPPLTPELSTIMGARNRTLRLSRRNLHSGSQGESPHVSSVLLPSVRVSGSRGGRVPAAGVGGPLILPLGQWAGDRPLTDDATAVHDLLVGLRPFIQRFDVGAPAGSSPVSAWVSAPVSHGLH